jgi:hypothetical protein
MRRFVFVFGLFLCSAFQASAEVRVFLLRIAKKADPQDYRLVTSTLDPLQYPRYHIVHDDEVVTYDATWRCPGRTGDFKPLCPNPKAPPEDETQSEGPEKNPSNP